MEELKKKEVLGAAVSWLSYIDEREYEKSWKAASISFRSNVSIQQWTESVSHVHKNLGIANRREIRSVEFADELPGAPDGEYAICKYDTSFEKKRNGKETVVLIRDHDGEESNWRITGYFVK